MIDLKEIAQVLSASDYEIDFIEKNQENPLDTLVCFMHGTGEPLPLEISVMPTNETDFDNYNLIQFFHEITCHDYNSETKKELGIYLNAINANMPLGYFGYFEKTKQCFYKHNCLIPNNPKELSLEGILDVVTVAARMMQLFRMDIITILENKNTAKSLLENHSFSQILV